ncbi:MAG: site-specific DNA-methyltransferase [Proteobacteria bacterium]|nr:site-specific DNA-methyltransferase [Pseudomonadota bacterium]
MKKLDPKTDGASPDIVEKNIEKIKELFPEVFIEKKIDFNVLREILGDYIDDRPERYSFTWNGKNHARRIAQTPSTGTLRPCPEESVNWNATQNLFIEGDNLEVLKLLQKSYHKKVKMIYIDPPYNTGNEFIYPDKFKDNLNTYLRYTGQIDKEGLKFSANSETSGRYHTNWLNMMYPRLKLAKNLLKDDGALFISIDDIEVSNLRKICDEIFGEENLMAIFPWRKRTAKNDCPFGISQDFEWCLAYTKFGQEETWMPVSTLLPEGIGNAENGTKEIDALFQRKIFPFPKPSTLIRHFLSLDPSSDGLVLDFFAGSCPTAQAVIELNVKDKGNRRFIMIQLPEPCDEKSEANKAGYESIAEIGKERIRRLIKKKEKENSEYSGDLGFKVFKLDSSNIKTWDADFDNLEDALFNAVENIKPDRSEADVLYELLLKYGLDLAVPIKEKKIEGKTVYIIGGGSLIVCLADNISLGVVEHIAALKNKLKPEVMRVIFKDSGFKDDVVKTNAVQTLHQAGIDDVKSL